MLQMYIICYYFASGPFINEVHFIDTHLLHHRSLIHVSFLHTLTCASWSLSRYSQDRHQFITG